MPNSIWVLRFTNWVLLFLINFWDRACDLASVLVLEQGKLNWQQFWYLIQNMNTGNFKGSAMSAASWKSGEAVPDQFPAGLRVLVVDDDPTCLMIVERMLKRCHYEGILIIFFKK